MTNCDVRVCSALSCLVLILAGVHSGVSAQAGAQAPRLAASPRAAESRPDLTGVWVVGPAGGAAPAAAAAPATSKGSVQVYLTLPGLNPDSPQVFKEMDALAVKLRAANPNKPVYKPELRAKVQELSDLQAKLDPAFFCKLPGVPRMGPPAQIVQTPGQVVLLYGEHNAFRVVPTDGRTHRADVEPSYLGDSIGWWEGDILVVEANQFTEDTWLGSDGYFHSAAMRVVERFQRVGDTLQYSATVHDPDVLAQPWTMGTRTLRISTSPADALVEAPPCIEKDAAHMTTTEHH
jgi:hypothetical protein